MDTERIINHFRQVLLGKDFVPLHEPVFQGNEWIYVQECLNSTYVSSVGPFVDRFEAMLEDYTGAKKAVSVVNGTSALHMALHLSGVERGDEVLMPALTFVATANAVTYCGAIPHFIDSEERTLGVDPWKLEDYLADIAVMRGNNAYNKLTDRRIRAVVPMHTYGHPVDLEPLLEICDRFKLQMIEDAAESMGSFYKGRHTGNFGLISILSFNGNKIITTGGGGAILTNDKGIAKLAKHVTTTAKRPHKWEFFHDQIGYNYRMPNINAALGCAQLEQLPLFLERKRNLAQRYNEAFSHAEGITFFMEPENSRSNYWLNVILIDEEPSNASGGLDALRNKRDLLLERTNSNGIMTRPAWTLMQKLPMYEHCPKMDLSTAERLEARLINIPSSAYL